MREAITLGVRLLAHNRARMLAISASVCVGVVVMFVELGLLQSIVDSQGLVARLVRGDLMVMNQAQVDLHHWNTIKDSELAQVAAVPGVAKVTPLYEGHVGLTSPDDKRIRRIIVYAFSPDDPPLAIGDPPLISAQLRRSNGFLFDARSRSIFGRIRPEMNIDIDKSPLTVAGLANMGPDLVNDGNIFMSDGEWRSETPNAEPIMGVVRLAPGAALETVRQRIYAQTPSDVVVLTPPEARRRETRAILTVAPIGVLFTVGFIAGMVIGTVNGYQILYTEVSDHLAQYATLKAMGFSDRFLHKTILAQALTLSAISFAVGLPAAALVDGYVAVITRLPVQIHPLSGALICLATIAACLLAGRLAMARLDAADPASLF
jgi:putative ABC transport system permease protein